MQSVRLSVPHVTPIATRSDVEKVVRREFPAGQFDAVMAILGGYGSDDGQPEPNRVRLAVLKLSAGKVDWLPLYLESAKHDYKDVLARAEQPGCREKAPRIDRTPSGLRERIFAEDRSQYESWLSR